MIRKLIQNVYFLYISWVDQIISFIEEVAIPNSARKNEKGEVETKVHIVGNSVGG